MITKSHIFLTEAHDISAQSGVVTCYPRECPLSTETPESRPAPGREDGILVPGAGWGEVSTSQVSVSSDKFLPWCQGSDKSSHILIAKAVINFLPHKLTTTQKHNGYCSAFLFIQLWLLNCCGSSLSFLIRIFCLISFSVSFNKVNTGWDLSKRIDPSPMNSEGCCIKHRSVSVWQYDAGWLSVIHVNSRDNLMLRARVFVTCYLITQCQNLDNYLSQKSRGIIDNLMDKTRSKIRKCFRLVDFW